MAKIILIWAQDKNGGIGKGNWLPWSIRSEMEHFTKTTTNKTVVMGKKTFDSISKPLPNRHNIVLTRNSNWTHEGVEVCSGMDDLLQKYPTHELFICGGKSIYEQFYPLADELIVSKIDAQYDCDSFLNFDFVDFDLTKKVDFDLFSVYYYKRKTSA